MIPSAARRRPDSALWAWKGWRDMARDVWRARELIFRLAYRDLAVRYRNSLLGYVWAMLVPLVTVGLLSFLVSRRVIHMDATTLPYPLFALWGIIVWQLFTGILSACTASLVNAGSLVTRINFAKEALLFSALAQPLVDFLIKVVLVAFAFGWFGIVPPPAALWIPLVLLPLVLLALGMGFLLAVMNLLIRDVANAVGIFASIGMLAAPVLYPPPTSFPFSLVNVLNPVSPMLIATQDLLAHGELQHPALFSAGLVCCLATFLLGWRFFRVAIIRVAERA